MIIDPSRANHCWHKELCYQFYKNEPKRTRIAIYAKTCQGSSFYSTNRHGDTEKQHSLWPPDNKYFCFPYRHELLGACVTWSERKGASRSEHTQNKTSTERYHHGSCTQCLDGDIQLYSSETRCEVRNSRWQYCTITKFKNEFIREIEETQKIFQSPLK